MSGSTLRLVLTALLYTSLQINCRTMYVPGSKTAEACSHRLRQKRYAFYSYEHIWPSEFMPLTFGIKTDKMPAPHTGINVQKLERYTAECAKVCTGQSSFDQYSYKTAGHPLVSPPHTVQEIIRFSST